MDTFFSPHHFRASLPSIWTGFQINLKMMVIAEVLVLAWALVLLLLRIAPGRAGLPLRILAVIYLDFFRGIPLLLVFLFVGLGLPAAQVQPFAGMSLYWLSITALVLTYGAYVAEVYRSGVEGVHWSQMAAARSLGLSYRQSMRHVILPQALRRVVPPLLNDFVSLQKDTSLAAILGVVEGANAAGIYAGQTFNATSFVGVALFFVAITIPLARLVDWLAARDQRRMRAQA